MNIFPTSAMILRLLLVVWLCCCVPTKCSASNSVVVVAAESDTAAAIRQFSHDIRRRRVGGGAQFVVRSVAARATASEPTVSTAATTLVKFPHRKLGSSHTTESTKNQSPQKRIKGGSKKSKGNNHHKGKGHDGSKRGKKKKGSSSKRHPHTTADKTVDKLGSSSSTTSSDDSVPCLIDGTSSSPAPTMVAADGIAPKELSSLSFSLGNIRPEGITQGKESGEFFIANLAFGGVRRLDIATGRLATVVPDQPYWERGAVGLAYALGMLVVSGGGSVFGWPGSVTVYDAETGVELASCLPSGDPARLLNGVAVVNDTAYITDSQRSVLMRLDINGARNGECITSSVPLIVVDYNNNNVDLFSTNEANVLLADGIVGYAEGLIIVNSAMGGLFYHDLSADTTVQIASSSVTGLRGDGLMVDEEHRLYVTHGSLSSATSSAIRVYDLTYNAAVRTVQALLVGTIQSPLLDSPSATADFGKYLVTTNARWDSLPFPAKDEGNLVAFAEQEFSVVVTKKSNLIPVRRRA